MRSERPRAAATSPDDDGDETASRTSSGGYSLLDFDDTLRLDTPPHEMTDAQIDELLSATTQDPDKIISTIATTTAPGAGTAPRQLH